MSKKITKEQVESEIDSCVFHKVEGTTTTICTIKTKSGPVFVGSSACISPEDFNQEIGECIAREEALSKLWSALGTAKAFNIAKCPFVQDSEVSA